MRHIGEVMPDIDASERKSQDWEKCITCGRKVQFFETEYKKPCEYCGTWVFERKKAISRKKKNIECWICLDVGLVEYPIQQDMGIYKYYARCNCPKGMKWPSSIPLFAECQHAPKPEFIELRNQKTLGNVWNG